MIRGGNRKITLTEEGRLLFKRAQEIIDLTEKTEAEIAQTDGNIHGDLWIGSGEIEGIRVIIVFIQSITTNQSKKGNPKEHL